MKYKTTNISSSPINKLHPRKISSNVLNSYIRVSHYSCTKYISVRTTVDKMNKIQNYNSEMCIIMFHYCLTKAKPRPGIRQILIKSISSNFFFIFFKVMLTFYTCNTCTGTRHPTQQCLPLGSAHLGRLWVQKV